MNFFFNALAFSILLVSITVALWLGLFLVTRATNSPRAWLSAITVWTMGAWFIHNVLRTSLPEYREFAWLLWIGQAIKFAPTLWFHLSCQLLYESAPVGPRQNLLLRWVIGLSYGITILQVIDTSRGFGALSRPEEIPSYGLFLAMLCILPPWAIWNFYRALVRVRFPMLRRQLLHLLVATAVAYVGGIYTGLGIYFRWELPFYPSYALLAIGVILLGYGVVKYDALIEGRAIERDALYSIVGVGVVTLFYTLVALLLWATGAIGIAALVTFLVCAVVTHTLSDGGRTILDRVFYRGHLRKLRTDLRQLAKETGTTSTLSEQLGLVLATICETVGAGDGFIATRQEEHSNFVVTNSRDAHWRERSVPPSTLVARELVELSDGMARPELEAMALLVPLHDNRMQIGALVLGRKFSGAPYRAEELEYLETVGPQLAEMIESSQQQEARVHQLERAMEEYRERERNLQMQMQQLVTSPTADAQAQTDIDDDTMVTLTEDALRHLNDFAYLGEHDLVKLQVVNKLVANATTPNHRLSGVTHVDQGKALHRLLLQAVDGLRPAGVQPSGHAVPSREWHNFLILHDNYVKGELTRDIMARLYIGEGTYNRTRRRALRSVARAIQEMEQQVLSEEAVKPQ